MHIGAEPKKIQEGPKISFYIEPVLERKKRVISELNS